jgi:hypothetical protein
MPLGRRIRRWKRRLAALMRRWAATLDGTPARSTPRHAATPRREAGPPAHWLAHLEKAGAELSWIELREPASGEPQSAERPAPDAPSAPAPVPSRRPEILDRFTAPRKSAPRPSTATPRARPASEPTPQSHPPFRAEDSSRTPAVPPPPQPPGAIVRRRAFASPPPPPRLRSPSGPRPQTPLAPAPSRAPSPFELPPVSRAAAPIEEAPRHAPPLHPHPRITRPADVEAPPRRSAPAPLATRSSHRPLPFLPAPPNLSARPNSPSRLALPDHASPFHPVRPPAGDLPSASPPDPRRTRLATPEPPAAPPLAPPWPELARRSASAVRPPPPVAAPWPELLIPSDDPVERALDELERTSRVDALAAQLGEKPWNAWPS